MNTSNNHPVANTNACQGLDCAAVNVGANDWFGDLEISEDVEVIARDQFGDMTGI